MIYVQLQWMNINHSNDICTVTHLTQFLDCQFQTRIVWSSEELRIHGYSYINPMKSKLMRKLLTYVNLQGESKRQANLERKNNLHDESMWFWCNLGVPITWTNIFSACSSKPRRGRHWKCNSVVIIRWNIKLVYNLFICFTLIL